MPDTAEPTRLSPETAAAFSDYIHAAETAMRANCTASGIFLWADEDPTRAAEIAKDKVVAQPWSAKKPIAVSAGLIHDWIGAARLPGVTVAEVVALVQSYDDHRNIYKPDVLDSKLLSRDGDHFTIFLRLLKKKVISVVLDTEHDVLYETISPTRSACSSRTTRISEVQNCGAKDEKVLPPDTGYGFLWRLNSYWRFEEKEDAVWIECRAISLTRDIPKGLAWVIDPIVRKLPRESLVNTLSATRRALQPRKASEPMTTE